jgi:endonuclease/exonuclease/phosphatase (EEP) superfamily protein YafD
VRFAILPSSWSRAARHCLIPLSILLLAWGVRSCAHLQSARPAIAPSMRVLTYNLDKDSADRSDAIKVIRDSQPDVILFQEASSEWQSMLRWHLAGEYPYASFNQPKIGYDGMGIMSKFPIVEETWLPGANGGWFPAQVVKLQTPMGQVQLLNVHLRPPASDTGNKLVGYFTTGPVRKREIAALHSHLKQGCPTLVIGDFNEGDDGGTVGWLEKKGFIDALPQFDRKTTTWQGEYKGLHFSDRPDHVLYTSELTCFESRVIPEKASDHDPVLAVLGLKARTQ